MNATIFISISKGFKRLAWAVKSSGLTCNLGRLALFRENDPERIIAISRWSLRSGAPPDRNQKIHFDPNGVAARSHDALRPRWGRSRYFLLSGGGAALTTG